MPKVGVATLPLDVGHCPRWLFEKMKRFSRLIMIAIIEEFGPEEFLRRLSDPIWFQSFSALIGMDWNSSGTTTITLGAIKSGIFDIQNELGIFVCGGKKVSRKTPEEIKKYSETLGLSQEKSNRLIYASKMAAKVDSSLIQNLQAPFQLYHHNFIFTKNGQWCVVQQAMAPEIQKARRYHWLSSKVSDFVQEPHSAIVSNIKLKPLNLTAKESDENRRISVAQVREEPKTFLKNIKIISEKSNTLIKQKRIPGFCEMELKDVEFHWHPVLKEKFDLKRLEKIVFFAHSQEPENFEKLLSLKGIGPKTIRALSLTGELIYGVAPSYRDPARYSFCVGGKDSTPYPIDQKTYSEAIEILEKGIKKAKISNREKIEAQGRLARNFIS
jgi:hypothetical protein